jgi:hypothetical protein
MGNRKHGLHGIKHRRPKSNVAKRLRKAKLVAMKKNLFAEIKTKLVSEYSNTQAE